MRAREDRRAAALTEQLDVDGWQVAAAQSMFDDDARAPPLWASEEHVLHLINRASAANVRLAEEEGRVCVGEARGMEDSHPLSLSVAETRDLRAAGSCSSVDGLRVCVVCCDERVQVKIYKGRDSRGVDFKEMMGCAEVPELLLSCDDGRGCLCPAQMCIKCMASWVVACARKWRQPTCPTCRAPFGLMHLQPAIN